MRQIILLLIFNGLMLVVFGQNQNNSEKEANSSIKEYRLKKANDLFSRLAYYDAALLYEELATENYQINKVASKLGDCYFNMRDMGKAEIWYGKAVKNAQIEPEYLLKYAQTLQSNKKYEEANLWMKKYHSLLEDSDKITLPYLASKDYAQTLQNKKTRYEVKNLTALNTAYSDFGAVEMGGKTAFVTARNANLIIKNTYAWNEKPFLDILIYDTTRKSKNPFSSIGVKINTRFHEGPLCFDSTGKTLYFTRNYYYEGKRVDSDNNVNNLMIYRTTYKNGKWSEIEAMPFNNKNYSVGHPSLSTDGKRLYFASNMPGGYGGTDLYSVEIVGAGFGKPVNLGPEINSQLNEMFPFVTKDKIYFSSDAHVGLGGLDIFSAKLNTDGKYQDITNLGAPINSSKDDFCFVFNKDKKSGFLASNREGGYGDDDIYGFSWVQKQINIKGVVLDSITQKPLAHASLKIHCTTNGTTIEIQANDKGEYAFPADAEQSYRIDASKASFIQNSRTVTVSENQSEDLVLNVPLNYESMGLVAKILDRTNNQPLKGVEITIKNRVNNTLIGKVKTSENGEMYIPLPDAKIGEVLKYEIKLNMPGYLAKTVTLDYPIQEMRNINLNELLDIMLDKIGLMADIGKIINVNPIYFDLAKWNIRPDAAVELDKIVKVMKENPTIVIELGSHTDCRGSAKYNLDLSDKRAKSSAAYIISKGISKARIYGKGYGESKLVNNCGCEGTVKSDCSEAEHQLNRRTEFIIVKM